MLALKSPHDFTAKYEVELVPALKWSCGHVIQYAQSGLTGHLTEKVCVRVFRDELRERLS